MGGDYLHRLEGGPGTTNMTFRDASRFADDRDVVLVGYRGVDGSVRLDCPEVEAAHRHVSDTLGEQAFDGYAAAFRACAHRLTANGIDLASYGLVQRVDDFEAARVALGYDRIDLLSESAGTRTALIYAWRYPNSIHRSVMIGVNPPGNFLWDAATTGEQIQRYAVRCAADTSCRRGTDDLAAAVQRMSAHMPGHWFFLPIKQSNVRIISFFGLMESTTKAGPASAPLTLDGWLAAASGDASGLWFASGFGDILFPKFAVWGQYAAAARVDAQAARAYFAGENPARELNLARAATAFTWSGGRLVDAWPAAPDENEYSQVRSSDVEMLLIGGELDVSTPPQIATRELLPALSNGHQVILRGIGHTASFWADQANAGTRLVNTYFASGQIDDSLYAPAQISFSPGVTGTLMAKIILGSVVGLVCLALLIVLVFWPAVPLDDGRLAVFATSLPIGVGVALAWLNPTDHRTRQAAGIAAAIAGALLGAWPGFQAAGDALAVLTAIAAAGAGANLALLVLDSAPMRAGRRTSETPPAGLGGSVQPRAVPHV